MTTPTTNPPVKLDAPGKGLPLPELLIARLLFSVEYRLTSRSAAEEKFTLRKNQILALAAPLTPAQLQQQVLIKRLPGLEDSSRFWSVGMTLDHLCIVNRSITGMILKLASGQNPGGPVSTADVKPSAPSPADILDQFRQTCDQFLAQTAPLPVLKGTPTWAHPWFGPLDAQAWHFLAGFHMGVHIKQIQSILKAASTTTRA
jgi:hypothetical protein